MIDWEKERDDEQLKKDAEKFRLGVFASMGKAALEMRQAVLGLALKINEAKEEIEALGKEMERLSEEIESLKADE